MIAGQHPVANAFEPGLRPILLALGAVPVTTRVVAIVERAAVITAIEGAAQGSCSTVDDVVERAPVRGQELPCVGRDVSECTLIEVIAR